MGNKSLNPFDKSNGHSAGQNSHPVAFSGDMTIDEVCCDLLDGLFPRAGGTIWKAPVILKFKDIFESQHQHIAIHGLHHRSTLSTPILTRIIRDLICHDFFDHHSPRTHLDLELHLRTIVAALRLLSAHGIEAGKGTLTFAYFDELYNRMARWQTYHLGQVERAKGVEETTKNYNNEFLIVYARDLISSVPSDRTVATNVAQRMIAAVSVLGHAYGKNVVQAAQCLKTTVQFKHPPSPWHVRFRTMDDLCIQLRVFRQLSQLNPPHTVDEWMESLPEFLETAEEVVINQLSEILLEELQKGLGKDKVGTVVRQGGDAVGAAPLARKNHFVYGILDLIQQHIQPLDSGKVNYKVMEFSLQVAKTAPYSYLRCKAFELLATMSLKPGIGRAPVEKVHDLLARDTWDDGVHEKVGNQWRIMRKRAVDMDCYIAELRNKSPNIIPLTLKNDDAPANRSVDKILDHVQDLENSLCCPIGTEEDPVRDLSPLLPCGHTVSMRAWRMYESKNPDRKCRCPVCNSHVDNIGEPLPMRRIAELIAGVREECQLLKGLSEWNQPIPPNPRNIESDALLIDLGPQDDEPAASFKKPSDDLVIGARPKLTPLSIDETALKIETKHPSISSPAPSVMLSPWPMSPEDFNSADIWETEAKDRDLFRLSDPAFHDGQQNASRQDTNETDYFSAPTLETTPGDFEFEVRSLGQTSTSDNVTVQFPKSNVSSSSFQPDPEPPPSNPPSGQISKASAVMEDAIQSHVNGRPSHVSGSTSSPQGALYHSVWEPSQAPPEKALRHLDASPDSSPEPRRGTAREDSTPRPSMNTTIPEVQPPSTSSLKHTISSNRVTTTLLSSPISQRQEIRTTPLDTRPRTNSIISDTTASTSPSSTAEHINFWRKASFSANLRKFSTSSAPRTTRHNGDAEPLLSPGDGFPDPGPTNPMRSFYLKAVAREQIGVSRKYQATAISETCLTMALVTSQDFSIYAVGEMATSRLICCGTNDGKYGKTVEDMRKDLNALARDFQPTFVRAVMNDRVLCVASVENCVDIYVNSTGRRIGTVQFPQRKCTSLKMSPNGEILAVGMETGQVLLYSAGSEENFDTMPVMLGERDSRAVNTIAFSPNSVFLATCSGNLVNTYRLGRERESPILLSKYNRHLTEKQCRPPYHGVTSITFSPSCTSLLVVSDAEGAYPVIVNNIISPEELHEPIPLVGKDTYKFKNCCAAYSPSLNAALIITRAGTVKLVNCGTGNRTWHVAELGERLDVGDKSWQYCALGFSRDGNRALALDRRGKIMMADFT